MGRRDPQPVPVAPDKPERLSMTLLSFFDRCPRSAYLHLMRDGGSSSHPMARGSLVHAFAEHATWLLIDKGTRTLWEPQAVQRDDRFGTLVMETEEEAKKGVSSLTAELVRECAKRLGRHVGQQERDDARVCAYHWAIGSDFDPESVEAVERKFVLDMGKFTIVGKVDLLHTLNGVLTVDDYKTQRYVTPRDEVEASFQLKMYAALVAFGEPVRREDCARCEGGGSYSDLAPCTTHGSDCACNGSRVEVDPCPDCDGRGYTEVREPRLALGVNAIQTREVYPWELGDDGLMRKQSRREPLTRTELADFLSDLEDTVAEFDAAFDTGDWEAIPGPHCGICPAWVECPITESVRAAAFDPDGTRQSDDAGLDTPEQAAEAVTRWTFLQALVKAEAKRIRPYLKENGPVVVGEFEVLLDTQDSMVTDHAALAQASASGQPFDLAHFRKARTSTVMKRRKRKSEAA